MTALGTIGPVVETADPAPKASSAAHIWLMAARPRTLPAAVAPVLVGTSLALGAGHFHPLAFVAALLGAVFIQVGTNLSNDYSDARRGADTEDRLGPVRVTAGGLVPPGRVLLATYVTFGLAVLCGVYLVAVAGWELIAVGATSILAGVLYTGGPRPYGYEGLGELFVFLFFGIVAVSGSYFVQVQPCRGRRSPARFRWACSRARSSWSTTCATSRPIGARASARLPCDLGGSARERCTRRWWRAHSCSCPCHGCSAL
jgi:1,4-dihydroxy-2-naphthoate octaprenyltransferase